MNHDDHPSDGRLYGQSIPRRSSGSLTEARATALHLPLMVRRTEDPHAAAFTKACDARTYGTGVSAQDRTLTFHASASEDADPSILRRPGRIFPLRASNGGVLVSDGNTTYDLVRLAGHILVGVLCELINPDGTTMHGPQIETFARRHGFSSVLLQS